MPLRAHLTVPGGILGDRIFGDASGVSWVEARNAGNHSPGIVLASGNAEDTPATRSLALHYSSLPDRTLSVSPLWCW